MINEPLSPAWFDRLGRVDTPTICNALELALGRRQITGFTYGTPIAAPVPLPPIFGYARTLRIRAAEPSTLSPAESKEQRLRYFHYVTPQEGLPVVLVVEDADERPGIGSYWGEVNSTVHKGLGVKGVLTNGSVRDLDELAPGFPIIAGSIGPSHAFVHIVDFDKSVTVFGLRVDPEDLIHADRHGAVIIPKEAFSNIEHCISVTIAKEKPILEAARRPGFSVKDIEKALMESSDIH